MGPWSQGCPAGPSPVTSGLTGSSETPVFHPKTSAPSVVFSQKHSEKCFGKMTPSGCLPTTPLLWPVTPLLAYSSGFQAIQRPSGVLGLWAKRAKSGSSQSPPLLGSVVIAWVRFILRRNKAQGWDWKVGVKKKKKKHQFEIHSCK